MHDQMRQHSTNASAETTVPPNPLPKSLKPKRENILTSRNEILNDFTVDPFCAAYTVQNLFMSNQISLFRTCP